MKRINRPALLTVLIAAVFSATVMIGVIFFAGFWRTGSSYKVSAYVSNARGIAVDSTVFEAGLPVGLVTGVRRNGADAILSMRLTSGPQPLPVDTKVLLGLRSLVGEVDVNLTIGTSKQTVRSGGSLGLSQDQDYTEVDQILNVFAGPNEAKARGFMQGVGNAVVGEGNNLNQTVGNGSSLVTNSLPLTSALAHQHEQVADIVQNVGNIMSAIGQRSTALKQFVTGATTTFNALTARDTALRRGLAQLPKFGSNLRDLGTRLNTVAPQITPVVTQVSDTLRKIQPTLKVLSPAAGSGEQLFEALGVAAPKLQGILANLTKLEPSANAALPAVHSTFCQLNPILRYASPYSGDLAAVFENFGGTTDAYLSNHELESTLLVQPAHLVRALNSPTTESTLSTLLDFGIFHTLGSNNGFDPAPGPGGDDNVTTGLGDSGPAQFGANHTYPHVTEDCSK